MRRYAAVVIALVALIALSLLGDTTAPRRTAAQTVGCGLANAAFCDPMNVAHANDPTLTRTQGLDPVLWGTSRVTQLTNAGQGYYDAFQPSTLATCPGAPLVLPEQNSQICGGALAESMNATTTDDFIVQAFYPRQPFDFAGRTGTISTTVDLLSEGIHGNWPDVSITDKPVPAPQPHGDINTPAEGSAPQNGVFISFAGQCADGGVTVDAVYVVRNYATTVYTPANQQCVLARASGAASVAGQLNLVQIQISSTSLDLAASDIGATTLKPIGHLDLSAPGAALTFTRGLIWLEDETYGPSGSGASILQNPDHEFQWGATAFDGPVLPRDLGFDVPDANVFTPGYNDLGYSVGGPPGRAFQVESLTQANINAASAAIVTFNWFATDVGGMTVSVNGSTPVATGYPWPDQNIYLWRTIAVPVPLSALSIGANTITIAELSGGAKAVANIDLILAGAGGVVGPTPTPSPTPTAPPTSTPASMTPTATASPTPAPATPSATPQPTATPSPTPQPSEVPTPAPSTTPVPSPSPSPTPAPLIDCPHGIAFLNDGAGGVELVCLGG